MEYFKKCALTLVPNNKCGTIHKNKENSYNIQFSTYFNNPYWTNETLIVLSNDLPAPGNFIFVNGVIHQVDKIDKINHGNTIENRIVYNNSDYIVYSEKKYNTIIAVSDFMEEISESIFQNQTLYVPQTYIQEYINDDCPKYAYVKYGIFSYNSSDDDYDAVNKEYYLLKNGNQIDIKNIYLIE